MVFRSRHDQFRSAVVNEPRGSDVLVGALLVPPENTSCAAGVIFFNNVGYLGMCGHGTIGLIVTLAHMRISQGCARPEKAQNDQQPAMPANKLKQFGKSISHRTTTAFLCRRASRRKRDVKEPGENQ